MNNHPYLAFENECIIVDSNGIPVNLIDGKIASKAIITEISKKDKHLIDNGGIDQELDACQIEIRNMGPKKYINQAQDELLNLFRIVEDCVKNEFGLYISQTVVPNQDFVPMHSAKIARYQEIHDTLLKQNNGVEYRKSTNIAGLHLNVDSELDKHLLLNNQMHQSFADKDYDSLGITQDRFDMYNLVVEGINKGLFLNFSSIPKYFKNLDEMKHHILDANGSPNPDYTYLRLKKLGEKFVSELRTVDGGTNESDLMYKTQKAYDIMKDIFF